MYRDISARASEVFDKIYELHQIKTCPIEATFKIIGKRWTALILREMFRGVTQFNRYHENIKGITSKMLSLRLRELEKCGIVNRRLVSMHPLRVEYQLTDLGLELGPLLLQAASFSMRWFPQVVFKDAKPRDPLKMYEKMPIAN